MGTFSRRAMFKNGVLAVGSGLLAPGIFEAMAAASAQAAGMAPYDAGNGKILVIVQMAGGNDGLHAIIPYADPHYAQLRPTLNVATTDQIKLNAQLALHAKLGAFKPMWDAGQMAVIENVGYPNPNLSHFQSTYIWETLDVTGAQGTARTGWLGKYLQGAGDSLQHPFTGLSSGSLLPEAFMAPSVSVPSITSSTTFGIKADPADKGRQAQRQQALLDFQTSYTSSSATQSAFGGLLNTTAQTASTAAAQFTKATGTYQPAKTANYPKSGLASGLQVIATAITQGLGVRIGYVTIGGFDTHANEGPVLDLLYPELAEGIAAFWRDMQAQGFANNIMMMTWSEFGRRAQENGSQGTDHGTAAPQFIFGPGVAGGVYGPAPDLGSLDANGNLVFQTDFRSVYGTLIDKWLGGNSQTVLGATYPTLDFVK